jgi:tetraacyldisaccharide 4'-kinase
LSVVEVSSWLQRQWYRITFWHLLLWPLSLVFGALVAMRRLAYRISVFSVWHAPVPVIVVGNIVVGGSGKTPLTIWLADFLKAQGYRPGIVSRGYGGHASLPQEVKPTDDAALVGDEPLLIARRSSCPVWIGKHRPSAVQGLLGAHPECNVLVCDDGLQHYRLGRDIEIAVMDGCRCFGNGMLLPAGPLREPLSRMGNVDAVVTNGGKAAQGAFLMRLTGGVFRNLLDGSRTASAADFAQLNLHAIAGIGNPRRFFDALEELGLKCETHPFPDHHPYRPAELQFEGAQAVLMTEKDAVKCTAFAQPTWWYLEVSTEVSDAFGEHILKKLKG